MDLLLILVLAAWILRQSARISALEQQIAALRSSMADERPLADPQAKTPAAEEDEREPLLLDTPLPPLFFAQRADQADEREPLLLDTPLPQASNDAAPMASEIEGAQIVVAAVTSDGPTTRSSSFAQWLSENGLAWLGGGALAIGIVWFLSFAAQQDWFTPGVQLACATVGGLVLLAASEGVRRERSALIAALLAAAGALAFYATAWAAYGGYHFVAWPTAAALLTVCAGVFLLLSLLHGEAFGMLAVIAAMLTPAIAEARAWPDAAITLYVSAVAAASFAVAWTKRWSWTATLALGGLYFWFAGAIAVADLTRAMILLGVGSIGVLVLAMRAPTTKDADGTLPWQRAVALGPTVAVCIGSVLMLWVWASAPLRGTGAMAAPTFTGVLHVALAGYAIRTRMLSPAAFVVAAGALVSGVALYLISRAPLAPPGADVYASVLAASVATALAALSARARGPARNLIAAAGGGASTILVLMAATTRNDWHGLAAWAALLAGAIFLFACAYSAARPVSDADSDLGVDAWLTGSAVLLLVGVESAWAAPMRATGDALAALLLASVYRWRGWRAARLAALAAAVLAVAHALTPELIAATLDGAMPLWRALLILATAAAALLAASFATRQRETNGVTTESLSSAALMLALVAAFLTLRWFAGGGANSPGTLSEQALRALTLLVAGYLALPRAGGEAGVIARWRGHALLALGLAYALIEAGLLANPWWGVAPGSVTGPPLLDTLLLAFAAPAAIALAAARRLYARQRNTARAYAASGGALALLWAALALRRAFHPAAMSWSEVGVFEGACYGLLLIAFALLAALIARLRDGPERLFAADLRRSTSFITWACLLAAVWIMVVMRHPWWGAPAPSSDLSRLMATLAQAWAATMSIGLGRALSRARGVDTTRFAAASAAALFIWSCGHAAIHIAPLTGLGGYAHALWPLALVTAGAAITAGAPGRDTVRAYLHDLDAIWATAVWPALAFAALGLWLLFNPWWGLAPSQSASLTAFGLLAYPLAAWMSLHARSLHGARWRTMLNPVAAVACVIHIFVAITLATRFLYRGEAMAQLGAGPLEMWSYSALWALYGGGMVAMGAFRRTQLLVWSGLALLAVTAVKVFVFDTAQLSGPIRAASAVGLGVVALSVAWATQRINRAPQPGDSPRRR
ncbi:MAG: DUF2339 domain-containing protein [Proteobacteria bacterium]|nr:DUF2339 domain-containing protein [Pseudomonadota bacterium]